MAPEQIAIWERKLRYEFEHAVKDAKERMRDREPESDQMTFQWTKKAFEEAR